MKHLPFLVAALFFAAGFLVDHYLVSAATRPSMQSKVDQAANSRFISEQERTHLSSPEIQAAAPLRLADPAPEREPVQPSDEEIERLKASIPEEKEVLTAARNAIGEIRVEHRLENSDGTVSESGATERGDAISRTLRNGTVLNDYVQGIDGNSVSRTFYSNGEVKGLSIRGPDGLQTTATFSSTGRFSGRVQELPDGRKISFGYDEKGNVVASWLESADGHSSYRF